MSRFQTLTPASLDRAAFVAAFADIYEHSPWVAEKAYDIGVSVELENGESYDATVHQYLTQDAVNAYQPGGKFQIKADPDDTSKVMIYRQA